MKTTLKSLLNELGVLYIVVFFLSFCLAEVLPTYLCFIIWAPMAIWIGLAVILFAAKIIVFLLTPLAKLYDKIYSNP